MRNSSSTITETIEQAIGEEVLKHIDMEAFAKSVAPKVVKTLESKLIEEMEHADMTWLVEQIIESDDIVQLVTSNITKAIKTGMKPPKQKSATS
jgi:hypothetical protein